MNLSEMIDFHTQKKAMCTIAMSTSVPIDYGVGRVADDGKLTYFEEKLILKGYPMSMGIHILESDTLSYCRPNTDLAHDVIPQLMKDGKSVYAYLTTKRHYDIGTFKTVEEVRNLIGKNSTLFQTLP